MGARRGTDFGGNDALLGVQVGGGLIDQVDVSRSAQRQRDGHTLQLPSTQILHLHSHDHSSFTHLTSLQFTSLILKSDWQVRPGTGVCGCMPACLGEVTQSLSPHRKASMTCSQETLVKRPSLQVETV